MERRLAVCLGALMLAAALGGCTASTTRDEERVVHLFVVNETPQAIRVLVTLDERLVLSAEVPASDPAGIVRSGDVLRLQVDEVAVKATEQSSGRSAERDVRLAAENSIVARFTADGLVIEHHEEKVLFA